MKMHLGKHGFALDIGIDSLHLSQKLSNILVHRIACMTGGSREKPNRIYVRYTKVPNQKTTTEIE